MRWSYDSDGQRTGLGLSRRHVAELRATTPAASSSGLRHPSLGAVELERDPAGRLVAARADGMRARWSFDDGDLAEYEFDAGAHVPLGAAGARRGRPRRRGERSTATAAATPTTRPASWWRRTRRPARSRSTTTPVGGSSARRRRRGRSPTSTTPPPSSPGAATRTEADRVRLRRGRPPRPRGRPRPQPLLGVGRAGAPSRHPLASRPASDEQTTSVVVDALGELAEVDGTPLLWDSADPLAPLAWLDEQAVVGAGAPWALAGGDGAATWLAPDWQGTVGDAARSVGSARRSRSRRHARPAARLPRRARARRRRVAARPRL